MPPRSWPLARRVLAPLLLLAAALVAAAPAAAAERPLVYTVVIDGLDGDRVEQGKAPFIASLIQGHGARTTYYRESRAIMASSTNPNHVAMMTGAYADRSGIPSNAFAIYAPVESEDSCVLEGPIDESKAPHETSGQHWSCLQVPTLFEAVDRQGNPEGIVTAAVFGKPKLGRIFAGRDAATGRHWADHLWAPCTSDAEDDDYCGDVPVNPATGYAVDDAVVMDEVIRTIREGVDAGGERRRPDFTLVNLHQVDSAGHGFGTDTGAYDTAIGMADDQVRRLVEELRARGEWPRTVLILLSDHSMDTAVQKTSTSRSFEEAGVDGSRYMIPSTLENGNIEFVYLTDRTAPDRHELLATMRRAALRTDGVAEAFYREANPADGGDRFTARALHPAWRLDGGRLPDLIVTHEPGGAFGEPTAASNPVPGHHGGPSALDNFFAVTGGGEFVRHGTREGQVAAFYDDTLLNPRQPENVDVATTVAGLFGLFAPGGSSGRFLDEAIVRAELPGRGEPAHRLRLRVKRVRGGYRLSWAPRGGHYHGQVRYCGRWHKLFHRRQAGALRFRARRDRRYTFRVRSRVASGKHGAWVARSAGRGSGGC